MMICEQVKKIKDSRFVEIKYQAPYAFRVLRDYFFDTATFRIFAGYIAKNPQKSFVRKLSIAQLKQFPQQTPSKDTLLYSYSFYHKLIKICSGDNPIENLSDQKQSTLNKHILSCFDWHYQPETFNLYLFSEDLQEKMPLHYFIRADLDQIVLVTICLQLIQAFIYIEDNMPDCVKDFNPMTDIYIDRKTFQIKLFGFGLERDSLNRSFQYLKEWSVYKFPFSQVGQFLPSKQFWAQYTELNKEKQKEIKMPDQPSYFTQQGKPIVSRKFPAFQARDHIWNIGLTLFQIFFNKIPIIQRPFNQKYLQIQIALRKIAQRGLQASQVKQKGQWKQILGCIMYKIISGMLQCDNFYPSQQHATQLQKQILRSMYKSQHSPQKNILKYWYNIFSQIQKQYFIHKYFCEDKNLQSLFSYKEKKYLIKSNSYFAQEQIQQKKTDKLKLINAFTHKKIQYLIYSQTVNNYIKTQDLKCKIIQQKQQEANSQILICFMLGSGYIIQELVNMYKSLQNEYLQRGLQKDEYISSEQKATLIEQKQKLLNLMKKWILKKYKKLKNQIETYNHKMIEHRFGDLNLKKPVRADGQTPSQTTGQTQIIIKLLEQNINQDHKSFINYIQPNQRHQNYNNEQLIQRINYIKQIMSIMSEKIRKTDGNLSRWIKILYEYWKNLHHIKDYKDKNNQFDYIMYADIIHKLQSYLLLIKSLQKLNDFDYNLQLEKIDNAIKLQEY